MKRQNRKQQPLSLPKRVKFAEEDESIVIGLDFISRSCCESIIKLCENHAALSNGNKWENDDVSRYEQATCDMEVEKNPQLVAYLNKIGIIHTIDRFYQLHHNQTINSFDDVFVVKYQASGSDVKSELPEHIDAGDISFMIALSEGGVDYEGGGTYFRLTDRVLHLSQGSMITFDAKLYHRGVKITRGVRYLLVGFCHTDPVAKLIEKLVVSGTGCDCIAYNIDVLFCCVHKVPVIRGNLTKSLVCTY